ncbi:hypothetical protein KFL_000100020 [Klebsormidium nitens]|uniref:Uncharacterized protein n=1 Tax=Klebsormidium nitens TaxID=105231 RepID=A0A1Y1HIC6_KLENI|nr:hypothetical protein KFL_000100020 [Klebsormidium nitens]|eukprot:GAQ78235.1 hypothetical protein KFL_000100020 [Klebsormidium nitens]
MAVNSSLLGFLGLLCIVLQIAEVLATPLGKDSGSVVPVTELQFRGETTAVAHRKLMQTLSPTQTLGTSFASLCAPIDQFKNPLTRVYCSYNVSIGGAPFMSLTVCTYNATGALLVAGLVTVPPATSIRGFTEILPTEPVSCPGSTFPNSCPASLQPNFADASAFYQQNICVYAVAASNTTTPLCAYDATGASTGINGRNCPSRIGGPPTPVASICAANDNSTPSKPLTRVYCLFNVNTNVTISGVPATPLTVCTYYATGALLPFPPATVLGVSTCPGSTAPNTCPASVQQTASANARAFFQQTICLYGNIASGTSSFCFYNATSAPIAGNAANCPKTIGGPSTPAPTPALTPAPTPLTSESHFK